MKTSQSTKDLLPFYSLRDIVILSRTLEIQLTVADFKREPSNLIANPAPYQLVLVLEFFVIKFHHDRMKFGTSPIVGKYLVVWTNESSDMKSVEREILRGTI